MFLSSRCLPGLEPTTEALKGWYSSTLNHPKVVQVSIISMKIKKLGARTLWNPKADSSRWTRLDFGNRCCWRRKKIEIEISKTSRPRKKIRFWRLFEKAVEKKSSQKKISCNWLGQQKLDKKGSIRWKKRINRRQRRRRRRRVSDTVRQDLSVTASKTKRLRNT